MEKIQNLFNVYIKNFNKYIELFKENKGIIISSDYFESVTLFTEENIIKKKNKELENLIKELKNEKN